MLSDSSVVMIWRRVSNFASARSSAEEHLKLILIGQDDDSLMYDAGSVILGLWGQQEFQNTLVPTADPNDGVATHLAMRARVANQCSGLNFQRLALVVNPANNFTFASKDLEGAHALLSQEGTDTHALMVKSPIGELLHFFDPDGNQFSLARITDQATGGTAGLFGVKLSALMKKRTSEVSHLVSISLMVSVLRSSTLFYRDILGLRELKGAKGMTAFDLGSSILTLQPEPTIHLVKGLSKAGRLNGDWIVFHVRDISESVNNLGKRGVKFPMGIETSVIGQMAYFQDPDGHSLVVWQPPADQSLGMKKINFYPVLNRILAERV